MSNTDSRHRAYTVDSRSKPRRTAQLQQAIEDIVKEIPRGSHLTAPEVYRRAREKGLQISLSTVYRCLNQLQAHGNVGTISGDHGRRYEAKDDDHDHDHLICVKCGLTIEFTDELIKGFGRAVAERKGFAHATSRFDILGICSTCKAKDEDHKISTAIGALENALASIGEIEQNTRAAIALLEARKTAKATELLAEISGRVDAVSSETTIAAETLTNNPL